MLLLLSRNSVNECGIIRLKLKKSSLDTDVNFEEKQQLSEFGIRWAMIIIIVRR